MHFFSKVKWLFIAKNMSLDIFSKKNALWAFFLVIYNEKIKNTDKEYNLL